MPAASYREGPDGHSSRKQNSKRRRAKCSPSFVSGRVIGHGDIPPRCVPECSAMALHRAVPRCSPQPRQHSVFRTSDRGAFSKSCLRRRFFLRGGRQLFGAGRIQAFVHGKIFANALSGDWQWQYTRAVRSRASIRGKIPPRCVLGRQSVASFALHASRKRPRTGKSPVRGKIRAPCIRNELALARYARHASEKPCKQPFGNTPREDPARKGRLSLHGPLESCTARRSCHPSWRQTARAPATPVPPNSVSRQS